MSLAAYLQNAKNGLGGIACVLLLWSLISGAVWCVSGKPIVNSFVIGLLLFYPFSLASAFLISRNDRRAGGELLFDCGPSPSRGAAYGNAVLFTALGAIGLWIVIHGATANIAGIGAILFCFSGSAF
jgi:hypothetical protein